ncbi:unnamed protein product [Euphydryas editha]|uniref:Nuclease HARBI1 n=1 Tax=Euphydryas editha TaxID=104508 RepID=A0AAU9TND7_EUPED|nr:unnamed protein product [Euphydryas editha]
MPIPAKIRLALTLRYLATGDSYKSLHYLFKVSTPAISQIIPEVCKAINSVLKDQIKLPQTPAEWLSIEEGFRRKFPRCVGAIDGKHIDVRYAASAPPTGVRERTQNNIFVHPEWQSLVVPPPYSGPYKVLGRKEKYFKILIEGKESTVSIDRLKSAFLLNST